MWGYELDWAGSEKGQAVGICEYGNEQRLMDTDENISLSLSNDKCFRPGL